MNYPILLKFSINSWEFLFLTRDRLCRIARQSISFENDGEPTTYPGKA